MFRRYPYPGWLVLSLLLWCVNELHFRSHRQERQPERMAGAIAADIKNRYSSFEGFSKDSLLVGRMCADSLTEKEADGLANGPFHIYLYDGDSLQYWSSNKVMGYYTDTPLNRPYLVHNEKGIFIQLNRLLPYGGRTKKLVALFPIFISYPLENEYLHSHFEASDYIPVKTRITSDSILPNSYPISLSASDRPVFYVHFNAEDLQPWVPDAVYLVMLCVALLVTVLWVQLMVLHIMRRRTAVVGLILTMAVIIATRTALYVSGLPFNLGTLTFFSPHLYHSGRFAASLGDLFINILLLLWLIVFIARHIPYKKFVSNVRSLALKWLVAVLLMMSLCGLSLLFIAVMRGLVLNSAISFDVSHFYSISLYTFLGLLAIGALAGIGCMVIYLFNVQFSVLVPARVAKYFLLGASGLLVLALTSNMQDVFSCSVMGWLILFIILIDIRNFTIVSDLFEPHMIFWAVFICCFSTIAIHYFNQEKERQDRQTFVEQRLSPHRDTVMENAFDKTATLIMKDRAVKSFLEYPTPAGRKALNQHFETQYFTGPANRYQVLTYFFSKDEDPLYNKDTTDFESLVDEKNESAVTNSEYLFYKESILDRHFYLSYIPIYADSSVNLLGYVIIDLDVKKRVTETVYPELLQPIGNKASASDNEYAYAIYVNDKLITQTNDFPFSTTLYDDTLKDQQFGYYKHDGITALHYKISDKRTVVVVHYHSELIEAITLFSYLFGIQVVLAILILLYRVFLSYFTGKLFNLRFLNLRRRIHFSMLLVIFISFVIIGGVTILFFTVEYQSSNSAKLQSAMQVAKQSVQDYLKHENAFEADYVFDSISRSTRFKYFITDIANNQKIDINIFDDRGTLFSTSQDDIYEKGLISRKMRPDAFYCLNNEGKSLVIQDERVALLSYLTAYEPLRDEDGVTLGYISVPFFSSQKDISYQISNIVVTLINLYAFIFLISGVMTVVITRWIVRTYNIISRQFERLNLQKNERLKWPYDDEIGKLVNEYNKMVQKVEENALVLAQSERERAWREMARQVAHEIKNPLTPMKLNVQYLQQAIRNNNPNIMQLADRVSGSIIEQIDNLSYIASEFSDFAKMPEAKPEDLLLSDLLGKAAELYRNDDTLDLTLTGTETPIMIHADKSQVLRVFTNLLENAKQAIPADRRGSISIRVAEDGGNVIVSISDNGTGIPDDVAARIFQPYFTTKTSGTGLGLAMTRKIIEMWHGKIWFESAENAGTTFFVSLAKI